MPTCGERESQVLSAVGQPVQDAQSPPVGRQLAPTAAVCGPRQQAQQVADLGRQLPVLCCDGPAEGRLQLVQVGQGCEFCKHRVSVLVAARLLLRVGPACGASSGPTLRPRMVAVVRRRRPWWCLSGLLLGCARVLAGRYWHPGSRKK